jgi:CRP-like cAMP-binding protein
MPTANSASDEFLAKIGDGLAVTKFQANQLIFAQGDPADALFYVRSGKVKITVVSHQGKEAVVALLGGGDFFGEGCLNGQMLRVTSAVTVDESSIARIAKDIALKTLNSEPAFAAAFISHLLERNLRMEADLADQLFNSSERRLARLLLILANFGKGEMAERITPKINQETLAEMVGTTRSRISYFMNKFRRLGLIDYNGEITVNRALLNFLLHDPGTAGNDADPET